MVRMKIAKCLPELTGGSPLRRTTVCRFYMVFFLVGVLQYQESVAQCSPQMGAPPPASAFNTGQVAPGANDPKWTIALDSITGQYRPAIVMSGLPSIYYNRTNWISFSPSGEHTSNRFFFYRMSIDLPCFNLCGKSYNEENAYCLNLDLYADNSIYEIFINGVPESANLGGIIPLSNPFNPANHTPGDKTTVSLCKNWKAGANTIIIQIASSATVAGLLVEPAISPLPPPDADSVSTTICEGEAIQFGNLHLTKSGYYFQSFPMPSGCDSNVVLDLTVHPRSFTEIDTSICEGDNYAGYTIGGTYTNTFASVNGCDSVRRLVLSVREKPKPESGITIGLCAGDTLLISPGIYSSYLWQDGSTQDYLVVKNTGLYSVTVSNSCGSATKQYQVKEGICETFFPNAFTPNNDRKNDVFKILTDLKFQEFQLSIYNRWGQQVFNTKNPLLGWDGYLNNKEQPSGTYIWRCIFKRSNLVTQLKGTVILIR